MHLGYLASIAVFFLLAGCRSALIGDAPPDSGYRQRIKDSPLVLYEFTYYGAAYTGDFNGMTLVDSTQAIERSQIERIPAGHFCAPPSGSEFCMVEIDHQRTYEKDTLLTPLSTRMETIAGIPFHITKYAQSYGSATFDTGLMRYEFDSVIEGTDSITLHGVSRIFGGHELPDTVTFEKGNIQVEDSSDHRIKSIWIERIIVKRGRIYKPTNPFEIVPDRPIVGVVNYQFFPRGLISSDSLSDFGIWKPVRSWPNGR